jgi:hypothetical protein
VATRQLADAFCQQSEQRVERLFYSLWHNADSAPRTPWRNTCSAAVTRPTTRFKQRHILQTMPGSKAEPSRIG